ncbi:alpha/beta hydrolase [Seongchinamella unica]|nr:alpha/beta hydrolase [Seongchinamella unica]
MPIPRSLVTLTLLVMTATCLLISLGAGISTPAAAQGPLENEMCGNGTTFTVDLGSDQLVVPDGCRIYALIASGYERNNNLDELTLYNFAKFVAENNGYVHYAWWNNLLREYMAGPLHSDDANPGGLAGIHAAGFIPLDSNFFNKAIPNEDFQFQSDARRLLQAIRSHNPNAVIIVAGHSMGGASVARLGASTPVAIDLLAPLDPVGNRSLPEGLFSPLQARPGAETYNWTRWRATHDFRGYRVWDCIRNALGLCRDFDDRLLFIEYRCGPSGPWLNHPPSAFSQAPLICPRGSDVFSGPVRDTGTLISFGSNVRRLYHRWQRENVFPFDFSSDYYYGHPSPLSNNILEPNYQRGLEKNALLESDPDKTCATPLKLDPRDPNFYCNPGDGHGEIVGFRGIPTAPDFPVALKASDWPGLAQDGTPEQRKQKFIEMVSAPSATPGKLSSHPPAWGHEPANPNLDMVASDLITITQQILLEAGPEPDSTPPTSTAVTAPGANSEGWHNEDVLITLSATDNVGGSGVKGLHYSLSGAHIASAMVSGDRAQLIVTEEGISVLSFYAHDNNGNYEEADTLIIRLDRTPPQISAVIDPPANSEGWHNGDLTVAFIAGDELSGLASVSPPVAVSEEGENREIIGTAADLAGNQSSLGVVVNVDKTAPTITGLPDEDCLLWPANHKLVQVSSPMAEDSLSGVAELVVEGVSNDAAAEDAVVIEDGNVLVRAERSGKGDGRTYTITALARDLAGNQTEASGTCIVPHDRRTSDHLR